MLPRELSVKAQLSDADIGFILKHLNIPCVNIDDIKDDKTTVSEAQMNGKENETANDEYESAKNSNSKDP